MDTTNYQIHLPALPDGWNRLSTEELEEVNRLYKRKEAMAAAGDEERADRLFKHARHGWVFEAGQNGLRLDAQ